MTAELDEDRFNMAIRKFLKHVGVTSQREIENLVRSGEVKGGKLKLRMTMSAEGTPLKHVVEDGRTLTIIPGRAALLVEDSSCSFPIRSLVSIRQRRDRVSRQNGLYSKPGGVLGE
jgi:Family of unknown function (DUF6494)